MNYLKLLVIYSLAIFVGFTIGRISHILGGDLASPHHWIYGLILIIIGLVFRKKSWGCWVFSFGLGLFISDLKDFFDLKFYGVDEVAIKRFWGID